MRRRSDTQIGTREFVAILVMVVGIKVTGVTPTILFSVAKNAAWTIPIIAVTVYVIPCVLLYVLLKAHKELGLIELIGRYLGRGLGLVVSFILFVYALASLVFYSRSTVDIVTTLFYPRTPVAVIYAVVLIGSCYVANRGLEGIGRTAWLSLPWIKGVLLLLYLLLLSSMDWGFLFPVGGPGWTELVKQGTYHSSILADVILLTIFFPYVRSIKAYQTATLVGIGIVTVEWVFSLVLFVTVLSYPSIENVTYPFHQITRMVQISVIFSNVEGFFLGFWVMASVIRFAVYLYVVAYIFSAMLRLDEFEPLILSFAGLTLFLGLMPENPAQTMKGIELLLTNSWFIFMVLPCLLWVISKMK